MKARTMSRKVFAYPYFLWMIVSIIVPLGLVLYYALTQDVNGDVVFSLDNLAKAFEGVNMTVFLRSIWLAALTTVICLVLGYPVALLLSRKQNKARNWIILFVLPMWMNFLLRTYAWMALLDNEGIINGFLHWLGLPGATLMYNSEAVVLGMVYNFLPFMILPIYSVLVKIPHSLSEAAEDLGANSMHIFRKVTLPLSMPGVVSGITMVFMPAITTFAISRLLGGSQFMMYGDLIENQFLLVRDWHFGSGLSVFMMVLILISMTILSRTEKGDEGGRSLW